MRVFITGVSGGLSSLLIDQAARLPEIECITGIDVVQPRRALPAKVQFIKMDVRSPELASAMAGHDTVVHTAFITYWQARMPAAVREDINVNGARNVARAAAVNHVQRFVHLSSTAAYDFSRIAGSSGVTEDSPLGQGNLNYYCNDKAAVERGLVEILGGSGTGLTILRPCAFVGPNSREVVKSVKDTAHRLPGRDPRVQVAHEDDVAAAVLHAMLNDMPGAFNVAPDDFVRMSEVWRITRVKWVPLVPTRLMQMYMQVRWKYMGWPWHPCWAGAALSDYTASNAKLKATGWKPRFKSAEAVRGTME